MSVGKIATKCFQGAWNYVKKNPDVAIFTGIGCGILGRYAFMSKKEKIEYKNQMALSDPIMNPFGCWHHMFNPDDHSVRSCDSIFAKWAVDRNNKDYQEYYSSLSPSDKVKEFYANGGRGIIS